MAVRPVTASRARATSPRGLSRYWASSERAPSSAAVAKAEPPLAFTPPPPERHITEGSLFIGDDRIIRQVAEGRAEPVTYCGVLLRTDGTPNARKIGALIELRDLARRVLQSQNEGWPEATATSARRALNHAYDRLRPGLTARSTRRPSAKRPTGRDPPHAQPGQIPGRPGCHAGDVARRIRRGDRQGGQGRRSCSEGRGGQEPRPSSTSLPPRKACW